MIALSTPTIYSVYHQGGFGGYNSPTSPASACSPTTPAFGYHHSMMQPLGFPGGFRPVQVQQPYGVLPTAIHPANAAFQQHRNALSAKNLQDFNAYQTRLYPDVYADYNQGPSSKSSSGVSSPTFPSGSMSPCDFPFGQPTTTMIQDFSGTSFR